MKHRFRLPALVGAVSIAIVQLLIPSCRLGDSEEDGERARGPNGSEADIKARLSRYATVRLEVDLSRLTAVERRMLALFVQAAEEMDEIFRRQSIGETRLRLPQERSRLVDRLIAVNYGPWDRLDGNEPFVPGVGPKPPGAGFYPADMTREEFDAQVQAHPEEAKRFRSLYTVILRNGVGGLLARSYHLHYAPQLRRASARLLEAAKLAEDADLARYLELRAAALLSDDYDESDIAWLRAKRNRIDIVIGPIEVYEDELYNQKAAYTAFVLVKDEEWSARLEGYAALLPDLQRGLPVAAEYRSETPGSSSDLNVYDLVYCAGDGNAGAKTIAINLPNDEDIQLRHGSRRLQLRNVMQAKFERILKPIAEILIAEDQRRSVTFAAFFQDVLFHEIAHGLGIKNTITGKGSVREALKDQAAALEEGKADVLGLYMISRLLSEGRLREGTLLEHYTAFLASTLRSIRFGATSAHGRAGIVRFNYFLERGAFARDGDTGTYRVNPAKMIAAVEALSALILELQGNGDIDGAKRLVAERGTLSEELEADLARLGGSDIPVDIIYDQGEGVVSGG